MFFFFCFVAQEIWTANQIKNNLKDPFWVTAGLVMEQFEGCVQGYHDSKFGQANPLPRFAFQMLNGVGDFLDLLPALHPEVPEFAKLRIKSGGMCSALIKVTGED